MQGESLPGLAQPCLIESQPFLAALQNFMRRGGTAFHEALVQVEHSAESSPPSGRKRKRKDNAYLGVEEAREFFEEHRRKTPKQGNVASLSDLVQAVSAIASTCAVSHGNSELFNRRQDLLTQRSDQRVFSNRQSAILDRLSEGEQKTVELEGLRRLRLLRINYEVDRLQSDVDQQLTPKGASETLLTAAIRNFSQLSGKAEKDIRALRKRARTYEALARYPHGLGMILMLGCDTRAL